MEYEIILIGDVYFCKGIQELKETLKNINSIDIRSIWKNIKYNCTCENVTMKYIKYSKCLGY